MADFPAKRFLEFTEDMLKHQESEIFFNQNLLAILERYFALPESLVVVYGDKLNFTGWVDRKTTLTDVSRHPYTYFHPRDRCSNYINHICSSDGTRMQSNAPRVFRASDIIPKQEYRNSDYALWLEENLGYRYSVALPFGKDGKFHLCFYKFLNQADFSDIEMNDLSRLYKLVHAAYDVFQKSRISKTIDGIKNSLISSLGTGIVIMSSDFKIIDFNGRAAECCAKLSLVCERGGRFDFLPLLFDGFPNGESFAQKTVKGCLLRLSALKIKNPLDCDEKLYILSMQKAADAELSAANRPIFTADLLTEREIQILDLLSLGQTYQNIADSLFISIHTVRNHIQNIFKKCNVNSQAQLVSRYIREKALQGFPIKISEK